jgi:hypothetical protein
VLPDRFENGDPPMIGRAAGGKLKTASIRRRRLLSRRRPGRPDGAARLYPGPGRDAVWLAPVFRNKPVQGAPGHEFRRAPRLLDHRLHRRRSALRHATPTSSRFRRRRPCARDEGLYGHHRQPHRRRDPAIANARRTTAPTAAKADYPVSRQGGIDGAPINDGFDGSNFRPAEALGLRLYALRPGGRGDGEGPGLAERSDLLPQPRRQTFAGESSTEGDFSGLDDLFTENPRVVQGFIDIYGQWIDDFGIDGFPDRHRPPREPRVLAGLRPGHAGAGQGRGIPTTSTSSARSMTTDPAMLARFTQVDRLSRPCWTSPSRRRRPMVANG